MNTGGHAYPVNTKDSYTLGMSRRQWLAGLAMQARTADLMTIAVLKNASFNFGEWLEWYDEVPKFAYKLADAMIAYEEKEKK